MAGQPIIPVDYEFVAGKHFFTAATEFGQGLCVAHSDLKLAYEEVGNQLKVILSENHEFKLNDNVEAMAPFEEFQAFLDATTGKSQHIKSKTTEVDWQAQELETA
jgi:hypothetical protein